MLHVLERFALWRHRRHCTLAEWWLSKAKAWREARRQMAEGYWGPLSW